MNLKSNNQQTLDALVAEAYQAFGRYRAPVGTLNACTVCCMSADLALEMTRLPLASLGSRHFYDYNCAAKREMEQPGEEILYFLPRLLDLMAQGEEVHHSLELSLDRLGACPPGTLDEGQSMVLNRFMLAYFENAVGPDRWGPEGRRLGEDPFAVLAMVHTAGLDIQPLLDWWLLTEDPRATVAFVQDCYWHEWGEADELNVFMKDRPEFTIQLRAWLRDPAHRSCWVDKLLRPDFLSLVEYQPSSPRVSFALMVEAAFDALTPPCAVAV